MRAQMTRPVQTQSQLSHPLETCTGCGWLFRDSPFRTCRECRVVRVIDINPHDDVQFDYDREREEQRITPLQQKWENG